MVKPLRKTVWSFLTTLNILSVWPSNPLLIVYLREMLCSHQNLYKNVLASLFIITKNHRQPKRPSVDEWINCSRSIQSDILLSNKKGTIANVTTTGIAPLKGIILREGSHYIEGHLWFHLYDILNEPKQKISGCQGLGMGQGVVTTARQAAQGRSVYLWFLYHCGGYRSQYMC